MGIFESKLAGRTDGPRDPGHIYSVTAYSVHSLLEYM
jgi:hypothetical protein